MKQLNIDHEFKTLIPQLAPDEYDQLAQNLIKEGCRDALVIWNNTIIDGHNRYDICTKNKIPFLIKEMDFTAREEAIEWIIRNQFGRRNLPSVARVKLALRLKDVIQERAKKNQEVRKGNQLGATSQTLGNLSQKVHTNKELGKIAGVSDETIRKYEVIQKEGTDEIKKEVDSGKKSINKGYEVTKPKLKVADANEETKVCGICEKEKPLHEFSPHTNNCKVCKASARRNGITDTQAKELNSVPNDELQRFYDEMKSPTPADTDEELSRNNVDSIISELDETLKLFRNNINKYAFMGKKKPSSETKFLINSIIEDLTKINSNIEE